METRFELQIEEVLAGTGKLVSYNLHSTTTEASDTILAKLVECIGVRTGDLRNSMNSQRRP